jgi:lysophospholipase L1-like esterase
VRVSGIIGQQIDAIIDFKANTYTKTEIDSKDATTLQSAKDYTNSEITNLGTLKANNTDVYTKSELQSQALGQSGVEKIGSPSISGVSGNNPYEQIKSVKEQLNSVVLNQIPNASITDEKLSDDLSGIKQRFASHLADYALKGTQTKLLSQAYQKLNKKQDMVIVCQGDSMTYGQDTASVDKRPAASGTTDSGASHTQTRAGVTYPEALQTYLRDAYNNNTTVINKGYSGDWAEASYNHWVTNSNADIALIELGTNDSNLGASWVPSNVRGSIDRYLTDMRRIIKRYIEWGTVVILLTPPRLRAQENPTTTTSWNTEPYRHALFILGDEFGCPVIDTETFLNGCNNTFYSDDVHLNTKGYQYFAARLASVLIGYGAKNPVKVQSGVALSIRQTRDNTIANGVTYSIGTTTAGPEESGAEDNGLVAAIGSTSEIFYGFETLEDDLILVPINFPSGGSSLKIELDFGLEQSTTPILPGINKSQPRTSPPLSTVEFNVKTSDNESYNGTINLSTTDRYLQISNKGWHNIKVSNGAGTGTNYFAGFVVMSYKHFAMYSSQALDVKIDIFQKLLYPDYTASPPTVNSLDITADELNRYFLKNKLYNGEWWRGVPVKVTLHNYDKCVIEYGFIWHDHSLGQTPTQGFHAWLIKQTDLVGSPTSYRTITSITYDSTNRKYVVNFGGNVNYLGSVVISTL